MRQVQTYGSIKDGVLKISYRDRFMESVRQMPDCRIRLTLEKLYRKRSNNQNAYYWSVIIYEFVENYRLATICPEEPQGETIEPEDAHVYLKAKCNPHPLTNTKTGEVLEIGKTTTNLTTVEFEEYLDRCRSFILEWFGVTVPMPNEQTEMEFEKSMQ